MKHIAHVTRTNGVIQRIEVEAMNRRQAVSLAFAEFPPCTVESVSAWPKDEQRLVVLNALGHRVAANTVYCSAFGCLA